MIINLNEWLKAFIINSMLGINVLGVALVFTITGANGRDHGDYYDYYCNDFDYNRCRDYDYDCYWSF